MLPPRFAVTGLLVFGVQPRPETGQSRAISPGECNSHDGGTRPSRARCSDREWSHQGDFEPASQAGFHDPGDRGAREVPDPWIVRHAYPYRLRGRTTDAVVRHSRRYDGAGPERI